MDEPECRDAKEIWEVARSNLDIGGQRKQSWLETLGTKMFMHLTQPLYLFE